MDRRNWLVILLIAVAAAFVAVVLAGNGGTAEPVAEADTATTSAPTTTHASIPSTTTTEPRPPSSTLAVGASVCEPYQAVSVAGTLESAALVETSGIAASRTAPGVIWAHNDSGDNPNIYAVGPEGEDLGSFTIDGGVAFDWEDVAIGPGPDPIRSYLYVGDIGDNFRIRQGQITVYRILEPEPASMAALIPAEEAITLHSPDGPHDFEALFVADESIYVATKDRETTLVYRTASPIDGASSVDLRARRRGRSGCRGHRRRYLVGRVDPCVPWLFDGLDVAPGPGHDHRRGTHRRSLHRSLPGRGPGRGPGLPQRREHHHRFGGSGTRGPCRAAGAVAPEAASPWRRLGRYQPHARFGTGGAVRLTSA